GELQKAKVKVNQGFFGKILAGNKPFIIDSSVRGNKEMRSFSDTYKMNNACLSPISAKGTPIGLLIIGNNLKDFVFQKDELEITNIFIRQIAIAVENDWLAKKAADLTLKDEITDLYNEKYINNRLQEEIKRAIMYQRPCSFAILNIDDFKAYKKNNSELAGEAVLKKITVILNKNISDVDKAARLKEDIFALILPETNKGEALKIVEKIRKIVEEFSFSGEKSQPGGRLTVSAGISANPIDGLTAGDLIEVASTALGKAKKEGKNKVAI
ncbi:MAG: sensor domain-containing diguanylate cyclase, partial [Candidatus Omnitrophota bacterium]|nr:sensor domain-containing diguanylate cyclase [Candidatus Omnitrophota bacterium]